MRIKLDKLEAKDRGVVREENHAHCCYKKDLKNIIQQAEEKLVEKFREVIGEDEVKKVVPPNKDDSYDSLNAQFKVMKYNQEQLPIRNQLREEQKAKMDEFLTKLEEEFQEEMDPESLELELTMRI